ncbi:MAG: sodium-dependent transporter [Gammaproteobacteria bacterium]|nr:sodium-dependent transporter [Gammaproteobacteria bacterium]
MIGQQETSAQGSWSSKLAFILAAVGAAVGLGNIWKFPYVAGVSGGGAFVLVYVGCVLLIAIPVLIGELLVGRRGRRSPPQAMRVVAAESGRAGHWGWVGGMGVVAGFLILTFYSVIAGWAMAYVLTAASGAFSGLDGAGSAAAFNTLLESPVRLVLWHTLFMALTTFIVCRGLQKGIERAVRILMPALFAMLLLLVGYALVAGDAAAGLLFLFRPDFSRIDGGVMLAAIGQAFFSVGVAMGLMMAYAAYIPREVSIARSAFVIVGADTLIAVLAGVAIFPIVFAAGLDPAEGPGLVFVTLPIAFGGMPGGTVLGTMFFLLLVFAAVTSSIAVLEPTVAWATERWMQPRWRVATVVGAVAWVCGLATAFSFNLWADLRPLGMFETFAGMTLFDVIDYLTANVLMPLGGLLISVFVAWRMRKSAVLDELGVADGGWFAVWRLLIGIVAPLAIALVFIANLS